VSEQDGDHKNPATPGVQTSGGLRSWVRRRIFGGEDKGVETEAVPGTSPLVTLTVAPTGDGDPGSLLKDVFPGGRTVPIEPVSEIATGGMAVVDRAHERSLLRDVALKRLRPELRGRGSAIQGFLREAQIMGQLDHPNVVPVHALGRDAEGIFFTMKLVEGQTVEELVDDLPDRSLDAHELYDVIEMVTKVCDALAFSHSRGVIHCDVKPSNVMVADFGQVYLMDWGVARLLSVPDEALPIPGLDNQETRNTGHSLGTPAFMAPEQVLGDPSLLDTRTDVFAVGCLMYSILTRHPPYVGRTLFQVLEKAESADYLPLDDACPPGSVPAGLIRIIHKAMADEAIDRYQSIEALRDDLGRFMRGGPEFPQLHFAPGDMILRQGERGDTAYIIESGRVEVLSDRDGQLVRVHVLGAGEVFGEIAILAETTRTATIRAIEPTTLREVDASVLEQELHGMKPWMGALVRSLAERFGSLGEGKQVAHSKEVISWVVMFLESFGEDRDGLRMASISKFFSLFASAGNIEKVQALVPALVIDLAADRMGHPSLADLRGELD
jgi:serine/threonine-protein kinase